MDAIPACFITIKEIFDISKEKNNKYQINCKYNLNKKKKRFSHVKITIIHTIIVNLMLQCIKDIIF